MFDFSAHPLVETTWLSVHLSDGDLCMVDARWRGDGKARELYLPTRTSSRSRSSRLAG